MEKTLLTLEKGTNCSSWNYCNQRPATGSTQGSLTIFDSPDPDSSSFTCTSKFRAHEASIVKVVWVPPEYGDAVACIFGDGTVSIWEEVVEDGQSLKWNLCNRFESNSSQVLDLQFGLSSTSLKMVWEFDEAHQRWRPVTELALPGDTGDQVYSVAWAQNIGRPYEVVAVGSSKGIAIWHLGLNPDTDGRLSVEKVALLSGHEGEVYNT
ncbi:hypothetical protein GIB67_011236 [Kingdonia uniflora]|uniref:Nucleoporin SEH1 n=1 Tax=Kingdonia uniflora TaxID=39325 RepID=A0A7J7M425_9MAGN|nr:hypothetical protein GIB67_011236 [Kingdonia uniflora]